ncbi:5'/3'-nucleotidase SurE [Yinghuangia aomiensis]
MGDFARAFLRCPYRPPGCRRTTKTRPDLVSGPDFVSSWRPETWHGSVREPKGSWRLSPSAPRWWGPPPRPRSRRRTPRRRRSGSTSCSATTTGTSSQFIRALQGALKAAGHNAVIVAPATDQSGKGTGINASPGAVFKAQQTEPGIWSVEGTPADSVGFGLKNVFLRARSRTW